MNRFKSVTRITALIVLVFGVTVLAGWQFRIGVLKGESFGTFVAPSAAFLSVLVSVASLLFLSQKRRNICFPLARGLGAIVALFSATTVAEHLFRVDLHIDRLVMSHRLGDWYLSSPVGRAALPTMVAFTLAGLGLMVVKIGRLGFFLDGAASVIAAISYLSLIGYLFGVSRFYGGIMALHTGIVIGIIGITLFTLREGSGIADVAASPTAGGVVFRRVALSIAALTPAVGLFRIKAQQEQLVDLSGGTALFVVVTVFVFTAITVGTAKKLNTLDVKSKLAEQSLVRTEKLAAAGRLSASIAHEINNPLEAVTNLLYLARTVASPEASLEYVSTAEREVRRASEIAKKTLGFYREDAKATNVHMEALLEEVLDIFHQKISSSRVEIEREIDGDALINARVGEIRQILANLVSNALDATNGASPKIVCRTRRASAGMVDVLISDNGKGVSPEHRAQIFQPFFTTKESVGTGLGLFVSKQLAEKNGGMLCLDTSTPWTTFRLTLPLAKSKS